MKQNFIGFADSDKFLAAVDSARPINLNVGRKFGKPDRRFGISVDSTVLTMSQVLGDEVLYFEHITHRYQVANGHILDHDEKKHIRLSAQVEEIAKQYLIDHALTWREALLSMPRTYITLNGHPTFLTWDKENECFRYRKEEGEPSC
jgi:hypothetical protein